MATFLPLLFPTGKLVSPRWRPVAWLTASVLALAIVVQAIAPRPMTEEVPAITNPVGIEGATAIIPVRAIRMVFCVATYPTNGELRRTTLGSLAEHPTTPRAALSAWGSGRRGWARHHHLAA